MSKSLARRILAGEFHEGDTAQVDAGHEGQLVFRRVGKTDEADTAMVEGEVVAA